MNFDVGCVDSRAIIYVPRSVKHASKTRVVENHSINNNL